MYDYSVNINTIIGKTLTGVHANEGDSEITFEFGNEVYSMYHEQDCCESVYIESIDGDINNLVGEVILDAREENSDNGPLDKWDESYTWTFYIIRTNKDSVTIRWYGTSNGYYSESVYFKRIN